MIRIPEAQASFIANQIYIAAFNSGTPSEVALRYLEMKDWWTDADRARKRELERIVEGGGVDMGGDSKLKTYLFQYRYEGAEYGLNVPACSLKEARGRVKAMSLARYDGILVARVPVNSLTAAPTGLVVRGITAVRNFFARPQ